MEDAGEYSCEMTEEEEDKTREFVTVAVFERQSEEEMSAGLISQEEEEEIEEIDFFVQLMWKTVNIKTVSMTRRTE